MTSSFKALAFAFGASTLLAACDNMATRQFVSTSGDLTYTDVSRIYSNLSAVEFARYDANRDGLLSPTEFDGIDSDDIKDRP